MPACCKTAHKLTAPLIDAKIYWWKGEKISFTLTRIHKACVCKSVCICVCVSLWELGLSLVPLTQLNYSCVTSNQLYNISQECRGAPNPCVWVHLFICRLQSTTLWLYLENWAILFLKTPRKKKKTSTFLCGACLNVPLGGCLMY